MIDCPRNLKVFTEFGSLSMFSLIVGAEVDESDFHICFFRDLLLFYPKTSVSREIFNITYVSERKRLSFIR